MTHFLKWEWLFVLGVLLLRLALYVGLVALGAYVAKRVWSWHSKRSG